MESFNELLAVLRELKAAKEKFQEAVIELDETEQKLRDILRPHIPML